MKNTDMNLREHWSTLDQLLTRHQALWSESVWANPTPNWANAYSDLFEQVIGVQSTSDNQLIHSPPHASWLEETDFKARQDLIDIQTLSNANRIETSFNNLSNRAFQGIKGRKIEQIKSILSLLNDQLPVFEWCCGKGHLARLHGRAHSLSGMGLELDPALCTTGEELAQKQGVELSIRSANALLDNSPLPKHHQIVALHACGDLHTHLIDRCASEHPAHVTIAPCCFHRSVHSTYVTKSTHSRTSTLLLDQSTLRLISEETTHASAREQRYTLQSQLWRLAFNVLIDSDNYIPTPSLGQGDFKNGFTHFVDNQLQRLSLNRVFTDQELTQALDKGRSLQQRYHQLSMVRQLFAPALELWIVLDLAIYLEEQGFYVKVGSFCDKQIAARNLIIQASHS